MLKKWTIENFKSFGEKTEIELAPITVFAGANSSGKSTIIQSILLAKQTVQYAQPSRSIALNGPLLKLGTFHDVKNIKTKSSHFSMGWTISVDQVDFSQSYHQQSLDLNPYLFYYPDASPFTEISCEIRIEADTHRVSESFPAVGSEIRQLNPQVSAVLFRTSAPVEAGTPARYLDLVRSQADIAERKRALGIGEEMSTIAAASLRYEVRKIDLESERSLKESKPGSQIIGATLRHFLPFQTAIRYDKAKELSRKISEFVGSGGRAPAYTLGEIASLELPVDIVRLIYRYIDDIRPGLPIQGDSLSLESVLTVEQMGQVLRKAALRLRSSSGTTVSAFADLQPEVEMAMNQKLPKRMEVDFEVPGHIFEATEYTRSFFISAVRYLGPLRDEPKPIYPLEALANPTEVGYRGEHTAAVLDLHRNLPVRYIPSSFIASGQVNATVVEATLHDAVVDWLNYVDVATEVTTGDQGKIGHQLQVRTKGVESFHDLTNVGVGVSQVLPIIVMALLANPGSLLIFEQPELHLHPKVQARLGDFFLSVSLNDKQCLLETHSEYLLDRLRLRIAESDGESLTSVLRLYFTERQYGETLLTSSAVSRYGVINYPPDFFDQSTSETERIVRAAISKRVAERAKSAE